MPVQQLVSNQRVSSIEFRDQSPTSIRLEYAHPEQNEIVDLEQKRQRHIENQRSEEAEDLLRQLRQRQSHWIERLKQERREKSGDGTEADVLDGRLDWLHQRHWALPA